MAQRTQVVFTDAIDGSEQAGTVRPGLGPLRVRAHVLVPLLGEVAIQGGQGDVGEQRGESPALHSSRWCLFPVPGAGHDPGFQESLHQREHALVLDPCPDPVHQGCVIDLVEAGPDASFLDPHGVNRPPVNHLACRDSPPPTYSGQAFPAAPGIGQAAIHSCRRGLRSHCLAHTRWPSWPGTCNGQRLCCCL
jgi:hypothetical protein